MWFWKKTRWYVPVLIIVFLVMLVTSLLVESIIGGQSGTSISSAHTLADMEQALDTQVFPKDNVVDVRITIDEEDFQDMLDNAELEEMKSADVEYNGIKIENVGIRTKGNSSLRSVVNSDSDRYSFKLSFDEYISNQTLFGVSKINLNNNFNDASYMREFLSYELASEMGLPVPKYSYVNVYVNDELWGFYLAVEQIGTAYLERNFDDAYGSLYKAEIATEGTDLVWTGDDRELYAGLVQKSERANDEALLQMIDELNNGSDYESVLDVEGVLKYIALNVVTYNMDSYIGGMMHNYYLYEQEGVFSVLPWDFNLAFDGMPNGGGGPPGGGNRGNAGNGMRGEAAAEIGGMGNAAPNENTGMAQLNIDNLTQNQNRPLIDRLLQVDEYKTLYHSYIREAIEGFLEQDTFAAKIAELQQLISPYVAQDPRPFFTYDEFLEGLDELIQTNAENVENIIQQLDGNTDDIASAVEVAANSTVEQQQPLEEQMQADERMMETQRQIPNDRLGQMQERMGNIPGNMQVPEGEQIPPGLPDGIVGRGQGGGMEPFAENQVANTGSAQDNKQTFIVSMISLAVLCLAAVFVTKYKNKSI